MKGMDSMDDLSMGHRLEPIDSPAAWRGGDLEASDAWRRRLTETELSALTRAAEETHASPCPGFGAGAFRVPELRPLFDWMAEQLEHGPGVVRVSGVPVERLSRETLR